MKITATIGRTTLLLTSMSDAESLLKVFATAKIVDREYLGYGQGHILRECESEGGAENGIAITVENLRLVSAADWPKVRDAAFSAANVARSAAARSDNDAVRAAAE